MFCNKPKKKNIYISNENTAEKILMHYEVRIRGLWKFPKPKIEFTILGIRNSENCTHI